MMNSELADTIRREVSNRPELRRDPWAGEHPLAGHCYVASEAYHHLSDHDTTPCHTRHNGVSHWYLRDSENNVIDLTAEQFSVEPSYEPQSDGKGFCTAEPSRRAQKLISSITSE